MPALIDNNISRLIERRTQLLGPGNPLFYDKPLHIVRGEDVWLFDESGQRFLDCYNNVPSVGHCHPVVVEALCQQAATLNTHTRYLHENILDYAERLLAKFDPSLNRIMFACTGSEANEIALQMARFNTGGRGLICSNATYHGNTAQVSQLNSIFEPFNGYGEHIRMVPWPDSYRGVDHLEAQALTNKYVSAVSNAIASFSEAGIPFAGMLVCPIFANEGLSEVAPQYLQQVAALVHKAGGLLIFDEVQAGFGRTGNWWGHEVSGVIPDIVTLGKPMGAGHPISGVVARGELVDAYRNAVMYFNTFGGNPVSCAVGLAVLDVMDQENLVRNSATVGNKVREGFTQLATQHEIIGDVRGHGLFFGIELVKDRKTKLPAPKETKKVVNNMRKAGVLMGNIGEYNNVLKLRPPLTFSEDHVDLLMTTLDDVLKNL